MTTQIVTVKIQDEPGTLGVCARALAQKNINVDGFCAVGGTVIILTSRADEATKALSAQGFEATTSEALEVLLPNRPGELARLGEALGTAGVNVQASFGCTPAGSSGPAAIYLAVDNPSIARPIVAQMSTATPTLRIN